MVICCAAAVHSKSNLDVSLLLACALALPRNQNVLPTKPFPSALTSLSNFLCLVVTRGERERGERSGLAKWYQS